MYINKLHLHNFKKFEDNSFYFHPNFTVLIGDNASGKTSILDSLGILLGTYLLRSNISIGRTGIKKEEAKFLVFEKEGQVYFEPQPEVYIEAEGLIHNQKISWRRDISDRGGKAKNLIDIGINDRKHVKQGKDIDLPIFLYYGTGRLWNTHRDVIIGAPESRLTGYRNCLDPKSDQYLFEKWFKHLELSSLQQGKEISALEAVRNAIMNCIPETSHFYYDIAKDQLIIKTSDTGFMPFNNLSDGYRNMVAMVADISHRTCRINPHKGLLAAKETSGVILIDEIDLHLHPKWQRSVVKGLQSTFPKLQFIATTHSPFILQSLSPGEVIDLNVKQAQPKSNIETASPAPQKEFSDQSIEDITEDVMGVDLPQRSLRLQELYTVAQQYYSILQDAKSVDEETKRKLKKELNRLAAPYSDNIAYHAFLEMESLAAGLEDIEGQDIDQ